MFVMYILYKFFFFAQPTPDSLMTQQLTQVSPHAQDWYRASIIYQVYPRSYYDTNGDGIDDSFAGVTTNAGKAKIKGFELEAWTGLFAPVRTPELLDHSNRDFHGVVDDIVLADRVHAVDGQASISVEAYPGGHGRLERIALLARQAMIVAGRVHVEATVQ